MASRSGAGLAAVLGGAAALAGWAAYRALGQERSAVVVPLQRLARHCSRRSRRHAPVPAALGASGRGEMGLSGVW